MILALVAVVAGCREYYERGPVKGEDGAMGTLSRYGNANCVIAYNKSEVEIDVKAYPVNEINHTTFSLEEDTKAAPISYADVVWCEAGLKFDEPVYDATKKVVKVTGIEGNGNALVAIRNEAGEILWSYHIWRPVEDPEEVLGYAALGGCDVMPMALGAMEKGRINSRGRLENFAQTAGLYYTYGRKDPLGRPDFSQGTTTSTFVPAYRPDGTMVDWANDVEGADAALTVVKSEYISNYQGDKTYKEVVDEAIRMVDTHSKEVMLDYAIKHPTTVITPAVGSSYWYATDSIYRDRTLWYQVKTCYDPCPEGYMVPPIKLYRGFLSSATTVISGGDDGIETSSNDYSGGPDAINATNNDNMMKYIGYQFRYYGSLDPTKLDYYPALGYRAGTSGKISYAGEWGMYGSYSFSFGVTTGYQRTMRFAQDTIQTYRGYDMHAMGSTIRCMKVAVFDAVDPDD